MNPSERRSKRTDSTLQHSPSEYQSTTLEWPLTGLKQLFDSSKGDHKSKVVKSPVFGGGRWTVLFYAQSGSDQYCSLYLNAEPLEHERINPLLSPAASSTTGSGGAGASGSGSGRHHGAVRKTEGSSEEHIWAREGLFRFTFTISVLNDKDADPLGRKEANDHVFSHKTSNWGWASFARRADVYYNNAKVKAADAFLITVQISTVYEKPRAYKPVGQAVPTPLISAWGSLLNDPEHSDVVFLFPSKRTVNGRRTGPTRKLYAIKKILAARSSYFRDMFEGGFLEAEQADVASEAGSASGHEDLVMTSRTRTRGTSGFSMTEEDDYRVFDMLMDNSDEELDYMSMDTPMTTSPSTPPLGATEDFSMLSGGLGADTSMSALAQGRDAMDSEGAEDDGEDRFHDHEEMSNNGDAGQNSSSVGHGSTTLQARHVAQDQSSANVSTHASSTPNPENMARNLTAKVETVDTGDRSGPASLGLANSSAVANSTFEERSPAPASRPLGSTLSNPTLKSAAGGSASGKIETPVAKSRARRQLNARAAVGPSTNAAPSSAPIRKRRQVVVQDSAYPTFRALLHFLYTNTVNFAPLTSSFLPSDMSMDELGGFPSTDRDSTNAQKFLLEMHRAHRRRDDLVESYCLQNPDKPVPCSAKAMYKLADKLHIEDLRQKAHDHIASSLTVQCIVYEAFGNFTMRFPEIRKMEIEFLLKHWAQVKKSVAMKTIFSRAAAHPGLAEVWPYLLSQLEYKRDEASSDDEDVE